ncbi:MAG: ABC transporter ATP-binding protein [Coriobacteriia bacterium]|nr:ABC transporter ATP-binding protein [Coriobacteriia bacterium]
MAASGNTGCLLEVEGLGVSYGRVRALGPVSFEVRAGQVVGIVGESGSGKSTLLRAIARLLPPQARVAEGDVRFAGQSLLALREADMRRLRGGKLSYLFQNGQLSLDPLFSVEDQFDEVLAAHGREMGRSEKVAVLESLGIDDVEHVLSSLPSELSGGLCQRVAIAFALAGEPLLLLADEPTSALDVDSRNQVGGLLRRLKNERDMAILLVGHDIEFVASLSDYLLVMRDGRVLESGDPQTVLKNPSHPYTRELIASIPRFERSFVSLRHEGSGDCRYIGKGHHAS